MSSRCTVSLRRVRCPVAIDYPIMRLPRKSIRVIQSGALTFLPPNYSVPPTTDSVLSIEYVDLADITVKIYVMVMSLNGMLCANCMSASCAVVVLSRSSYQIIDARRKKDCATQTAIRARFCDC